MILGVKGREITVNLQPSQQRGSPQNLSSPAHIKLLIYLNIRMQVIMGEFAILNIWGRISSPLFYLQRRYHDPSARQDEGNEKGRQILENKEQAGMFFGIRNLDTFSNPENLLQ